jgi:hypothetical protein
MFLTVDVLGQKVDVLVVDVLEVDVLEVDQMGCGHVLVPQAFFKCLQVARHV